jgi:hypothetical protein
MRHWRLYACMLVCEPAVRREGVLPADARLSSIHDRRKQ